MSSKCFYRFLAGSPTRKLVKDYLATSEREHVYNALKIGRQRSILCSGHCEVKKKLVLYVTFTATKKIKSAPGAAFSGKRSTSADINTASRTPVQTIHSRVHFADLLRVFRRRQTFIVPKISRGAGVLTFDFCLEQTASNLLLVIYCRFEQMLASCIIKPCQITGVFAQ